MKVDVLAGADVAARAAADFIAAEARRAIAARSRFTVAVSGGRTPWQMLRELATAPLPWGAIHLFQVDERVAPAGDPDRNWTHIAESFLATAALAPANAHAMPVEDADLAEAAARYARELASVAGSPAVLDLVHLGLGPDGHTASLVPGDPVLDVSDRFVGVTGNYAGRARMTLTYPALNAARRVLWLVTGAEKAPMLARLQAGDRGIPAGRVRSDEAVILADAAAASGGAPRQ